MILVVGLAVAGLAGIAAAFYFSIRSSHGGKRLRSAGSGHAGGDRRPGSRSHGTARPDRTDNGRRAANGSRSAYVGRGANTPTRNYRAEDSTGPNPVLDFGDPALVGGRRGGSVASAGDPQATDPRLGVAVAVESRLEESRPGSRSAARLSREAHAAEGGDGAARPRRRVGFRKGADVDEELWPTETFGGVSDEQFWDDLASDKPLTTTARTAQQESGTRTSAPGHRPASPRCRRRPRSPSRRCRLPINACGPKMPPAQKCRRPEDAGPEQAGAGADCDPACPGRRGHQPADECRQPAVAGR